MNHTDIGRIVYTLRGYRSNGLHKNEK